MPINQQFIQSCIIYSVLGHSFIADCLLNTNFPFSVVQWPESILFPIISAS